MDPSLEELVLAAVVGAAFFSLIRRAITPSIEVRVERLEQLFVPFSSAVTELRAARDGGTHDRNDVVTPDSAVDGWCCDTVAADTTYRGNFDGRDQCDGHASVRTELDDQLAHRASHPLDRSLERPNTLGEPRMTEHSDQRDPE